MTEAERREYGFILRENNQELIKEFQERMRKLHAYTESFSDYMYDMIKRSGMTKAVVAQRAGLSRDYMYKILNANSGKRTEERDYIIAICMAANMSYMETQHALELYPFPLLSDADDRSAVIIMALLENTTIDILNEMLENAGHELLRTSPEMKKTTIGPVRSTIFEPESVSSEHDEELIAFVIRRMKMKNEERIEIWDELFCVAPIDYATNAEMKINDNGTEKYVQVYLTPEFCNMSVSIHSLHEYDPDDESKCWTPDSCEEFFDTYMADDVISEIEDEDEADSYDVFSMMMKLASSSKYYQLYLKLNAAIDEHKTGPGTEVEIEKTKTEYLGKESSYYVSVVVLERDGHGGTIQKKLDRLLKYVFVDDAITAAKMIWDDEMDVPGDHVGIFSVSVTTEDGKLLWEDGYKY